MKEKRQQKVGSGHRTEGNDDTQPPTPHPSLPIPLLWSGVLVLVAILYLQTATFQFLWDDEQVIYGRVDYRSPAEWRSALSQPLDFSPNYFRPFALLTLIAQLWIWQDNPLPFHLANVLIHLVNTLLVMALISRWTQHGWAGAIGGLAYGIHPALVESVAFVSSRYDLVMTTFALLTVWFSLVAHGWKRVVGVSLAFLLALLCKEMAVTLIAVIPLLHWAQMDGSGASGEGGFRARLRTLWQAHKGVYAGLAVTLGAYLGIRYLTLGYLLTTSPEGLQISAGTPLQHLLLIGRTFTTLIGLVVFPFFQISPVHHSPLPIPLSDTWAWVQTGIAGVLLILVGVLAWRTSTGRLLLTGVVSLLPVLNLRPLEFAYGIYTAERFLTFPLALFLLGFVDGALRSHRVRSVVQLGSALWLAGAGITTATVLPNWREPLGFWQWVTQVAPQSPIGHSNLSDLYNKRGEYRLALESAERAIQIAPDSGMGWINKGVALLQLGDRQGAIEMFRKGTEVEPSNIIGWNNLAIMLSEQGELEEAEAIVRQHVLGHPAYFMGHQALGLIYFRKGRPDLAEEQFQEALKYLTVTRGSVPEEFLERLKSAEPWLAGAYRAVLENDLPLAEKLLARAQTLNPSKISLAFVQGSLLLAKGRVDEAERLAQEMVDYGYHDPRLYELLAQCAQQRGDSARAQRLLQQARELMRPAR